MSDTEAENDTPQVAGNDDASATSSEVAAAAPENPPPDENEGADADDDDDNDQGDDDDDEGDDDLLDNISKEIIMHFYTSPLNKDEIISNVFQIKKTQDAKKIMEDIESGLFFITTASSSKDQEFYRKSKKKISIQGEDIYNNKKKIY